MGIFTPARLLVSNTIWLLQNIFQIDKLTLVNQISKRMLLAPLLIVGSQILVFNTLFYVYVYKEIFVRLLLNVKYIGSFGGFLNGKDRFHAWQQRDPVVVLFLIKFQGNGEEFYQQFYNGITNSIEQKIDCYTSKLFAVINEFLGYSYWAMNVIPVTDCIKRLRKSGTGNFVNKPNLLQIVEEGCNLPLPRENTGLWDISIGSQIVHWNDNLMEENKQVYPLVLRYQRCLGDAVDVQKTILWLLEGNSKDVNGDEDKTGNTPTNLLPKMNVLSNLFSALFHPCAASMSALRTIVNLNLIPSVALGNGVLLNAEQNPWSGQMLARSKFICIADDEKAKRYFNVVKEIKRKCGEVTFEDVVNSAFGASIYEYFVALGLPYTPNYLLSDLSVFKKANCLSKLTRVSNPVCENDASFAFMMIPMDSQFINEDKLTKSMLDHICLEKKTVTMNNEPQVHHQLQNWVLDLLPTRFAQKLIIQYSCMISLNNLPGPEKQVLINGCKVVKYFAWLPHRETTGIALSVTSYSGKLFLALSADKRFFGDKSDVQKLLDRIYDNLDTLNELVYKSEIPDQN